MLPRRRGWFLLDLARVAVYSPPLHLCRAIHTRGRISPAHRQPFSRLTIQPSRLLSHSRNPPPPPPPLHRHHKDLYSVLGVSPNATQQQIKDQFYKLSMLYHPDRNRGSRGAHQRFSEITEAYSILGQHSLRRKYDRGLLQEYPTKPHPDHAHSHHHQHRRDGGHPDTAMSRKGQKKMYDFDEFYRAHYGEALRWQRERRATQKATVAEQKRLATLSEPMHRLLIISVVLSVFLVGWMGAKYRDNQQRQGKWV